jgi:hypothetical protein
LIVSCWVLAEVTSKLVTHPAAPHLTNSCVARRSDVTWLWKTVARSSPARAAAPAAAPAERRTRTRTSRPGRRTQRERTRADGGEAAAHVTMTTTNRRPPPSIVLDNATETIALPPPLSRPRLLHPPPRRHATFRCAGARPPLPGAAAGRHVRCGHKPRAERSPSAHPRRDAAGPSEGPAQPRATGGRAR